jgi:hypothetical protein
MRHESLRFNDCPRRTQRETFDHEHFFYLPGMNLWIRWRYLFACMSIILLAFIAISLFDVVIAVFNPRFYSNAAFIVTFGVGGIFAGFLAYTISTEAAPVKNEFTRWSLIILMIVGGLLFFFLFSELEGGEYRMPFKAFGVTLALTTPFFMKGKPA